MFSLLIQNSTFKIHNFIKFSLRLSKPIHFVKRCGINYNIRVHTVNTKVFATMINTDATDYRYAYKAELKEFKLPDEIAQRCIRLSQDIGLTFAGIDLMITPNNQVFCLEVNPSPAFSYYEAHTKQPIAQSVACYLAYGN
ncbi:MAG: hypothetical protein AB1397_02695 [bacterium]